MGGGDSDQPRLTWLPGTAKWAPNVPLYWGHETSGVMRALVQKFLSDDDDLTSDELDMLTWYVKQWTAAMPLRPVEYEDRLASVRTKGELRKYTHELLRRWGIDPF